VRNASGFTLVELILVMAVLAIVMALSAPSLSRSLRERSLEQEATRFLALTEFARNEAISQGVPMVIWIEVETRRFGLEPKTDYGGANIRREYTLHSDVHVEFDKSAVSSNEKQAIEFAPEGTPDAASVESVRLVDRFGSARLISKRTDGWGYEILLEERQ
jgi:type II secretion system protein H